jgi:hypothetical protein
VIDEAEPRDAILFFDEADARFSKGTEARETHDRAVNAEAGELLVKADWQKPGQNGL